jgi:hypothetical protein
MGQHHHTLERPPGFLPKETRGPFSMPGRSTMCTECLTTDYEVKNQFVEMLAERSLDPTLSDKLTVDPETVVGAARLLTNEEYPLVTAESKLIIASHLEAYELASEEEKPKALEHLEAAIQRFLADMGDADVLTTMDDGRLDNMTKDTVEYDITMYPEKNMGEAWIRGIQHMHYYHERWAQSAIELLPKEFWQAVTRQCQRYAETGLTSLPAFGSALLVINHEGARDALAAMLVPVFMEGLLAGHYAGSQALDCPLGFSHQFGPMGDDRVEVPREKYNQALKEAVEKVFGPEKD